MKIKSVEWDFANERYVVELQNDRETIVWFKYLSSTAFHNSKELKKWLESFIEDAELR